MAKEQVEKIKVLFDADTDSVEKGLKKVVNLATTNSKKLAKLGNIYTKKINFTHKEAINLYKNLTKESQRYASANVTGVKEQLQLQKKLEKTYQRMQGIQKELGNVKDARNLGKARLEEFQDLQKEMKSITAELQKQNALAEKEGTMGYMERVEDYVDKLKEATKLNSEMISDDDERDKYLEKQSQKIEKIKEWYKNQLDMAKDIANEEERRAKIASLTARLGRKTARVEAQTTRAEFGAKIGEFGAGQLSKVTGMSFDPSDFAKKMGGLATKFEKMGGMASNLSGIFKMLGVVASRLVTFLGGFAVALIAAVIAADKYDKEIKSKLLGGVGATGLGNLDDMAKAGAQGGLGSFTGVGPFEGLRATQEEITGVQNELLKASVTVKNLGGDMGDFNKVTKTSMAVARTFGLSLEEGGQMVGDYFAAYGKGAEQIEDTFNVMTKAMKDANMSSTAFLGIMKSVSAQFNVFLDQTSQFAQVIGKLGKTGELTTKQVEEFANTFAGYGRKGLDESIRWMAVNQKSVKKIAMLRRKELEDQIKSGKLDKRERFQQLQQLQALNKVEGGDTLTAASALPRALDTFDQIAAELDEQGITSAKDLDANMDNVGMLKKLSAINGRSDEENQKLLMGVRNVLIAQGKTDKIDMRELRGALKDYAEPSKDEAVNTAKAIAAETVPKTAALQEVGNALLYQLVKILNSIYSIFANSRLFGSKKDSDKAAANEAATVGDARAAFRKDLEQSNKDAKDAVDKFYARNTDPTKVGAGSKFIMSTLPAAQQKRLGGEAAAGMPTAAPGAAAPGTLPKSIFEMYGPGVGGGYPAGAAANPTVPGAKAAGAPAAGAAGAGGAAGDNVTINAVLKLKDNQAIETVVEQVAYNRERRTTGTR